MNRRGFFTAAAGIVGAAAIPSLGKTSECPFPFPDTADGVMVITVWIGQLPPYKAEAFVERLKDRFKESMKKHGLIKWETYWLPDRGNANDIELYVRDEGQIKKLEPLYLDFFSERPTREDIFEPAKEFVLLMLGAPVVSIELDERQLDLCVNEAIDALEAHYPNALLPEGMYTRLAKDGALALAKTMLGRIRSKFSHYPGPCHEICLDGETLLAEGKEGWDRFISAVRPDRFTNG